MSDAPGRDNSVGWDASGRDRDRGLGTAYERYCFYQLLDTWADRYQIQSFLEGPLDGMAGVVGVHGVGLARRGIRVTSVVPTDEQAEIARGIYKACGADSNVEIRVMGDPSGISVLAQHDMVLAYHALPQVPAWREYLTTLNGLAKNAVVVTVCNPDNWGVSAIRFAAKLRGIEGLDPPAVWQTETLAPELWRLGRVREHVYFDCPWWPDLQVSAGQSLSDRVRQLFRQTKKDVQFTADSSGVQLAAKYVYGPERWPYFGGEGWYDELMPALLRHPGFDSTGPKWGKYLAHLHAFVVDKRPRTPQARRRLAQIEG